MRLTLGNRYVVTKGSDNGTFEEGDHIYMQDEDHLICIGAGRWLDKDDVEEATKRMEVRVDIEWLQKKISKLRDELDFYSQLLSEAQIRGK